MITIELTKEVAHGMIDDQKRHVLNINELPFTKFSIEFPFSVLTTEEKIISQLKDTYKSALSVNNERKLRQVVENYINSHVNLLIEKGNGCVKITLSDSDNVLLVYKVNEILNFFPIVQYNNISSLPQYEALKLNRIVAGTVDFFNSPSIVKHKEEKKVLNPAKIGRNLSKKKKMYIYKTVYTFNPSSKHVRNYTRAAEGWTVRGHWREYKTGKKIWINDYAKGDAKAAEGSKDYKITRLT